jgi:anthranilate synthase/aminodeoxychorismate synthase-like glutamine amidotransferase
VATKIRNYRIFISSLCLHRALTAQSCYLFNYMTCKILLIDNYDSFTFNLYQELGALCAERSEEFKIEVRRNDEVSLDWVRAQRYSKIIISPGPGDPADAAYFGICGGVLTDIGRTVPTLGVCLGMQGMAHYFGGKVIRATLPMHGKMSPISHDGRGVFRGLPQGLEVMRYHSLVVERESLPPELEITATTRLPSSKEEVMGLRHRTFPIEGIQFHPESYATEGGREILRNFVVTESAHTSSAPPHYCRP